MKTAVLLIFTIAFTNAFYLDHLVERQRRDTPLKLNLGPGFLFASANKRPIDTFTNKQGYQGRVGYGGNLMNNEYGIVEGRGYGSGTWVSGNLKPGYGGSLGWSGSRGSASLGTDHVIGIGTQFDAKGTGIIHRFDENTKLEGYGSYSQHYSPMGNSRPNYAIGLDFEKKF